MDKLGFANGIELSDDESFVLVVETSKSRVQKYHLKGPKAGKSEIFIEALPGCPDNIHGDGQGNFLVSLITHADEEHPHLFQSLAPHPYLRKMLLRLMGVIEAPFKFLERAYPNYYTKRIIHAVGHFESAGFLFEPRVDVLRIDPSGKILDVLEGKDGQVGSISSAFVFDGYLWLGSYKNDYLARVPLEKALPGFEKVVKKEKKVEPEVITTTSRPVTTTTTPRPTTTTPKPTTTTPKPTTTTPRPTTTTTTTQKPTTTTQKPTTTTTTTTQKPTTTTQKPTTTTQKPKTTTQPPKKPVQQQKKAQPDVKPVREEPERKNEKLRDEI